MRTFRRLIIASFILSWLASEATAPATATEDMSGNWRRTREGWQRIEGFRPPIPYRRPALHPAVVGSLELLLTMTAMLALSHERNAGTIARTSNIGERAATRPENALTSCWDMGESITVASTQSHCVPSPTEPAPAK